MDAFDRKILAELQAEGRLTVTELAARVSLSVAPCHRRLRELERIKVIRGYRAIIDPAAIGLGFEVLVQVTMDREDTTTITRFESGLAEIAEVRHAERLFGDPDYLIRVATADLAAYQALRDEKLAALPGVLNVFFLAGVNDFQIHLAAKSPDDLRDFVVRNLSASRDVATTETNLIFEHITGTALA